MYKNTHTNIQTYGGRKLNPQQRTEKQTTMGEGGKERERKKKERREGRRKGIEEILGIIQRVQKIHMLLDGMITMSPDLYLGQES